MNEDKEIITCNVAKTVNISAAAAGSGLKNYPAISKNTKEKIFAAAKTLTGYLGKHLSRILVQSKNCNFL